MHGRIYIYKLPSVKEYAKTRLKQMDPMQRESIARHASGDTRTVYLLSCLRVPSAARR